MVHEKFRDRFGFLCRHHKIDIVHNFSAPSIAAGDLYLKRVRIRCQIFPQVLGFGRNLPKLKISGVFRTPFDRFADFRLRGFAESRQLRDFARLACLSQFLDGANF